MSADGRDYTLRYWRGFIAYLLTQTDPRSCVEREEHERVGSEESFPLVYEAVWVKLFRYFRGPAEGNGWSELCQLQQEAHPGVENSWLTRWTPEVFPSLHKVW